MVGGGESSEGRRGGVLKLLQDGQGQFNEERDTYPGGWESKNVLSLARQKDKQ